ncbi:MAG: hypothetical protein LBU32_33090 [Clostridiales bacterium]|nr:hypothetical protein [Clostridiales bacterium]
MGAFDSKIGAAAMIKDVRRGPQPAAPTLIWGGFASFATGNAPGSKPPGSAAPH